MHIGSSVGITLLEFKEETEGNLEAPQPTTPKGEEPATDELLECPDR